MLVGLAMADLVLVETLALAVPLRIHELLQLEPHRRGKVAGRWARQAADKVGSQGDKLQFRTRTRRRHQQACIEDGTQLTCDCLDGTATVFNHMARGLAALALVPGGAAFGGIHWCAEHPGGTRTETPWELGCGHATGFGSTPADRMWRQQVVETVTVAGGLL